MQVQHKKVEVKKTNKKNDKVKSSDSTQSDKIKESDLYVYVDSEAVEEWSDQHMKQYADFNQDGKVDKNDKKILTENISNNSDDLIYDINRDDQIDHDDLKVLNKYLKGEDVAGYIEGSEEAALGLKVDLKEVSQLYMESEGDYNDDGKIDKSDATQLQQDILKGKKISFDINGDEKTDIKDATVLEKYINQEDVSGDINGFSLNMFYHRAYRNQIRTYKNKLKVELDKINTTIKDFNGDGKIDSTDELILDLALMSEKERKERSENAGTFTEGHVKHQVFTYDEYLDLIKKDDYLKGLYQKKIELESSIDSYTILIDSCNNDINKLKFYKKTFDYEGYLGFEYDVSDYDYKEFAEFVVQGNFDQKSKEYTNNLIDEANKKNYSEEEFKEKYPGFFPTYQDGKCVAVDYDSLAVYEYLDENYDLDNLPGFEENINSYPKIDVNGNVEYVTEMYKSPEIVLMRELSTYLTPAETRMYHYIFSTKGKSAADEFICLHYDDIQKRAGYAMALNEISSYRLDEDGNFSDEVGDQIINNFNLGTRDVLVGLGDYVQGWGRLVETSATDDIKNTANDYYKEFFNQFVQEKADGGIEIMTHNFSYGVGQTMIPVAVSIATSGVSSTTSLAGKAVVGAIKFFSVAGSNYGNMAYKYMADGYDPAKSRFLAALIATTDAGSEVLFGTILNDPGILVFDSFVEGLEEGGAALARIGLEKALLGKDYTIDEIDAELENAVKYGMMYGAFYSGMKKIYHKTKNKFGEVVIKEIDVDQAVKKLSQGIDPITGKKIKKGKKVDSGISDQFEYDEKFLIDKETGTKVKMSRKAYKKRKKMIKGKYGTEIALSLDKFEKKYVANAVANAYKKKGNSYINSLKDSYPESADALGKIDLEKYYKYDSDGSIISFDSDALAKKINKEVKGKVSVDEIKEEMSVDTTLIEGKGEKIRNKKENEVMDAIIMNTMGNVDKTISRYLTDELEEETDQELTEYL